MSLYTQRVGSLILGISAALSTISNLDRHSKQVRADDRQVSGNTLVTGDQGSQTNPKAEENKKKEEIRKWLFLNSGSRTAQEVVGNPTKYKVDENDIDFAIGKKMILQDTKTGDLEFVDDNQRNWIRFSDPFIPENRNKRVIRRDNCPWFNIRIGGNPHTTELIKSNETLRNKVQAFLISNLGDVFSEGLAANMNDYPMDNELIDACTKNKVARATFFFARKPGFTVSDVHREIVRTNIKLPLSRGVVGNPNYVQEGLKDVPQEDKEVCRKHPKSDVAAILSKLDIYQFEEADMEAAMATVSSLGDITVEYQQFEDNSSSYTANIVKKLNRPVTAKEIEAARNNPNRDLAKVAANRFYLEGRKPEDIEKDVELAINLAEEAHKKGKTAPTDPFINRTQIKLAEGTEGKTSVSPTFSEKLFANPALHLNERIIRLAMSEPYCYMGISEVIAEREDFPVTEEALKLVDEKPDSFFAKGLKTNLAIQELRKVAQDFKELIGKITSEARLVEHAKSRLQNIDNEIEEAKGRDYTTRQINGIKQQLANGIKNLPLFLETQVETKKVTDEATFEKEVLESKMPVLVYFSAPGCRQCLQMDPIVNESASYYRGIFNVAKVNTDNNKNLADKYNILTTPSLVIFRGGLPIGRIVGPYSKAELFKTIEGNFPHLETSLSIKLLLLTQAVH